MDIKQCKESVIDERATMSVFQPSNMANYAKLVVAERMIRASGHDARIVSDDTLIIYYRSESGHDLKLETKMNYKSVSFQLCIPLEFRSGSKDVLSTLNKLNDYSRENNHSEFWAMGYGGKVYLYNMLIDDGHFEKMGDVVTYLVSDLLEFAEYGIQKLSDVLQTDYVPSSSECTDMYR